MTKKAAIQPIYTENDFESMGWHDCTIYGIRFPSPDEYELLLDIDYIFEWIDPSGDSEYFSFLVSPATLCFEGAYDLRINLETSKSLEISNISRLSSKEWLIETQEGSIELKASGFKQFIRDYPKKIDTQGLERSVIGFSFEKVAIKSGID